jgi:type IV pilus assembly protein PilE
MLMEHQGHGRTELTRRRDKGFTLIELIVVVLIVALLLTLILPAYQEQLRGTRRSLGRAELLKVMTRQEQYFLDHKRYAETLTDLGLPENPYAINSQGDAVPSIAKGRIYLISLVTNNYSYTLTAVPQLSQSADRVCGTLSLASTGLKQSTGEGSVQECW